MLSYLRDCMQGVTSCESLKITRWVVRFFYPRLDQVISMPCMSVQARPSTHPCRNACNITLTIKFCAQSGRTFLANLIKLRLSVKAHSFDTLKSYTGGVLVSGKITKTLNNN